MQIKMWIKSGYNLENMFAWFYAWIINLAAGVMGASQIDSVFHVFVYYMPCCKK